MYRTSRRPYLLRVRDWRGRRRTHARRRALRRLDFALQVAGLVVVTLAAGASAASAGAIVARWLL